KITRQSGDRPGPAIWQIGTDGGLLDQPVALSGREKRRAGSLLLAPAERADIIIDFADFANETLLLLNTANAPYPSGDPPDPMTNGQVMQFRVNLPRQGQDTSFDPAAPWATLRGSNSAARNRAVDQSRPRHDRSRSDDRQAKTAYVDRGGR